MDIHFQTGPGLLTGKAIAVCAQGTEASTWGVLTVQAATPGDPALVSYSEWETHRVVQ